MTNRRNIFSRFFRLLVMLHKISYAHFTEWNNKRKRKAFAAGIYFLSILPEFVLLAGTFLAARGQDGYVHLVNVPQKVVFYGLASLAVLLSAIPLGFFDDKKICKEVRQELRERPRYWKRAIAVYWAVIVAMVVAANIVFPTFSDKTMPPENERTEVPQRWRDYLSLRFAIVARQETPNEVLQRLIDQDGPHDTLRETSLCHASKKGGHGWRVPCRVAEPCHIRGNQRRQTKICRMYMG